MRSHFLYNTFYMVVRGIVGIAAALFIALVYGVFVQFLWNWLMPQIFHAQEVTYFQATGLVVLMRLLVGSLGYHKNGRHGCYKNQNHHNIQEQYPKTDIKESEQ